MDATIDFRHVADVGSAVVDELAWIARERSRSKGSRSKGIPDDGDAEYDYELFGPPAENDAWANETARTTGENSTDDAAIESAAFQYLYGDETDDGEAERSDAEKLEMRKNVTAACCDAADMLWVHNCSSLQWMRRERAADEKWWREQVVPATSCLPVRLTHSHAMVCVRLLFSPGMPDARDSSPTSRTDCTWNDLLYPAYLADMLCTHLPRLPRGRGGISPTPAPRQGDPAANVPFVLRRMAKVKKLHDITCRRKSATREKNAKLPTTDDMFRKAVARVIGHVHFPFPSTVTALGNSRVRHFALRSLAEQLTFGGGNASGNVVVEPPAGAYALGKARPVREIAGTYVSRLLRRYRGSALAERYSPRNGSMYWVSANSMPHYLYLADMHALTPYKHGHGVGGIHHRNTHVTSCTDSYATTVITARKPTPSGNSSELITIAVPQTPLRFPYMLRACVNAPKGRLVVSRFYTRCNTDYVVDGDVLDDGTRCTPCGLRSMATHDPRCR